MVSKLKRMVRRVRFGKPVVVVSGLPRSGTSMLMKMLEAGGLPVVADGIRTADEDNPKGYYEDERVKGLAEQAEARETTEGAATVDTRCSADALMGGMQRIANRFAGR